MQLTEYAHTIVGEATYTGAKCLLVRFHGCNLDCKWCDSKGMTIKGNRVPFAELGIRICDEKERIILLTGGEPMIHHDFDRLVGLLLMHGKFIIIESNGTINIENYLFKNVHLSIDVKTPSSGCSDRFDIANLPLLRDTDALKFIVRTRDDFDWSLKFIDEHPTEARKYIQPVWGQLSGRRLAKWILESDAEVLLGLQLHKYIGIV
jgi:7-carboxy-7-deazaguanine synthase